jgi:diaminopimelate epimerase
MIPDIRFDKLSAAGNDFICIDNRAGRFDALLAEPARAGHFAASLCARGHGVGADGVIFASHPEIENVAHIAAQFYEADGSSCDLCGNGTGCFTDWAIASGFVPDTQLQILTDAGVVLGSRCDDGYVRVCIPSPENTRRDLTIEAAGRSFTGDYTEVGIGHLVIPVDDLAGLDIRRFGPPLRYHEAFAPRGVNVNFVEILGPGRIAVRTWEFGVEGETLACGTGSSAAAILTTLRADWAGPIRQHETPVTVRTAGGDELRIYFNVDASETVTDPCLETLVRPIFHGQLSAEFASAAWGEASAEGHDAA